MHEDPAYKKERLIERYFILRILDKIKPGGLACLVCPTNIVGNTGRKWEEFRIALSKKAEFLGAHKLPSKTFSAQGIDTVVDVVVLRKHGRELLDKIEDIPFDTLKRANVVWGEFVKGRYWAGEGRPFIMGKYVPKKAGERFSREIVDGEIDSGTLKAKLAQKFSSRIDWDALDMAEPITRAYAEGDRRSIGEVMYELRGGAAQVFQALRIEVNDEMCALREMLQQALQVLKPSNRCSKLPQGPCLFRQNRLLPFTRYIRIFCPPSR